MSLWNILRNNIGKDLSKVSMPVQLNEPLNTLQRLCEELEYSSLLDQASRMADPCERMVPTQGHLFLPRFCLSFCHPRSPLGGFPMLEHYIKTSDFAAVPIPRLLYTCGTRLPTGVHRSLCCLRLLFHVPQGGMQALQPGPGRDLRVRAA